MIQGTSDRPLFIVTKKGYFEMSTLNIKKNYLVNNRCYQRGDICEKIGIQIHTIGTGQGTAQSVADYWNQGTIPACVHYICDADVPGDALQLLPETYRSWADAGWGNNNLISIEICESDYIHYTNGASYDIDDMAKFKADILRGYGTAVQLCAKICKERGWNPIAKLGNGMYLISSHNEGRLAGLSSAHVDPDHVWNRFGLTMDGFRKSVKAAMDSGAGLYYVRKTFADKESQIGSYTYLDNAKKVCRSGYHIYDADGKLIYSAPVFQKGIRYRMQTDLTLRTEPKASAALVQYDTIPAAKRHYFKRGGSGEALIRKGTVDKCLGEEQVRSRGVYMKLTRGWILAQYREKNRVAKV